MENKEIKILAIVGTNNSESKTKKYIQDLLNSLKSKFCSEDRKIVFEIMVTGEEDIRHCSGTGNCFSTHNCPLDKIDKFNEIKEKMKESDVLILGCPVYAENISGDMKILIDRIAHWTHCRELEGKHSVGIVTANFEAGEIALNYLKKILLKLGTKIEMLVEVNHSSSFTEMYKKIHVKEMEAFIKKI